MPPSQVDPHSASQANESGWKEEDWKAEIVRHGQAKKWWGDRSDLEKWAVRFLKGLARDLMTIRQRKLFGNPAEKEYGLCVKFDQDPDSRLWTMSQVFPGRSEKIQKELAPALQQALAGIPQRADMIDPKVSVTCSFNIDPENIHRSSPWAMALAAHWDSEVSHRCEPPLPWKEQDFFWFETKVDTIFSDCNGLALYLMNRAPDVAVDAEVVSAMTQMTDSSPPSGMIYRSDGQGWSIYSAGYSVITGDLSQ